MARKAGPGDGEEDAPQGGAELSPEESGFVPDARLAEEGAQGAEPRSTGEDPGPGASLDEGPGIAAPERGSEGLGKEAEDSRASSDLVSAAPEDWRLAGPPERRPDAESRPLGIDAPGEEAGGTADVEPVGPTGSAGDRADSGGLRSDPFLLTPPARPSEEAERRPEVSAFGSPGEAVAPTSEPPRRRGGIGGLLLGGMIAAALGFGAAWLAQERLGLSSARLPADLEERLAALEARPVSEVTDLQPFAERLADAEARLGALEDTPVPAAEPAEAIDLGPLRQEIAQGLAEARSQAASLEERLAALEAQPAAPTGDAASLGSLVQDPGPAVRPAPAVDTEALRRDLLAAIEPRLTASEAGLADTQAGLADTQAGLAEVRTALSDAQAALDALAGRLDAAEAQSAAAAEEARTAAATLAEAESRAATAESQARARAALGQLDAALAAGDPFDASLAELGGTGVAVPDTLAQLAAEGVPTLARLRETFPEAARAGLSSAREQGLLDDGSGVMGFLRGQLSVRSVAPREGDDPDAVLSRAEAQLAAGQLGAALAEIGSLPEPVRAAMADWIALAETRAQANAALADLRDALPADEASPAD